MAIKTAIVGRPNVGKSTLFNRLAGRKLAIVDDMPGVTRDRREAKGRLGDLDLLLIDTAGFEEIDDESLEAVSYTHLDVYKRQGRDCTRFDGNPCTKWSTRSGKCPC